MSLSTRVRVAAVQMVSSHIVEDNLREASDLIARAAGEGARVIALPEYFCLMGRKDRDKVERREEDGHGPIQDFLAREAGRHGIWLIGGTVPLSCPDPDRVFNALLVYDPRGRRAARYDKVHLFAFQSGAEAYDEARTIAPGRESLAFDCDLGDAGTLRVGVCVCYDLRFPELTRRLAGADLIVVPAAFTATTGRAHWETLLRARAIENLCYVLACAQGGRHSNGRDTWGHSMLIDPWGEVLAERAQGAGWVAGEIDPQQIATCRARLPALDHRIF